ncbi:MAG: mechanosensitive ion channel family protein [Syntrophomonadaceae bacterium]
MEIFAAWIRQPIQLGIHPSLQRLGVALLILLAFYLLQKIYSRYIFNAVLRVFQKANIGFYSRVAVAFKRPVGVFILVLGVYASLSYLAVQKPQDLLLLDLLRTAIIILLAWGLYALVEEKVLLTDEFQEKLNIDPILIHFASKVIRFIIVALAICIVAQEWDYNISGLIAGLGLGGLAFALAAKDTLANLFGGMVIIMDKPFTLGDWISTSRIEGTVENISFRSTRIKTFAQAVVTVPNSTLVNEAITNWSKMGKRRINFSLGLTYDTSSEKLKKCIGAIREMLQAHPEVHEDTIMVCFDKFSDSSLDVLIYFFTKETGWEEHLAVKEDINLKIMNILESEGVSLAFPTRSIYIENSADKFEQG